MDSSIALKALATRRFAENDSIPAEVRPGLFLGSIGAAENAEWLDSQMVTHVLSLGGDEMLAQLKAVPARVEAGTLTHSAVKISDKSTENLGTHLDDCVRFIDQALGGTVVTRQDKNVAGMASRGRILVHCFQGKSRSAGIVAAWLMEREQLTYEESLEIIRTVRPRACPNLGFALQLRKRGRCPLPQKTENSSKCENNHELEDNSDKADTSRSEGAGSSGRSARSTFFITTLTIVMGLIYPSSSLIMPRRHWYYRQKNICSCTNSDAHTIREETYEYEGKNCSFFFTAKKSTLSPTLICVHPVGIGCSKWFFKRFAKCWHGSQKNGMVACADFLGCGSSERYEPDSDEAWGPQLMSNWIGQLDVLMDDPRIGPGPVVLVSQGGLAPVAISLASRRPDRVQSLVLCTPPSWANLEKEIPRKEVENNLSLLERLPRFLFEVLASKKAIKFFSEEFLFASSDADSEWLEETTMDASDYSSRHAIWNFNSGVCETANYARVLSELTQPVLVVVGTDATTAARDRPFMAASDAAVSSSLALKQAHERVKPFADNAKTHTEILIGGKNILPWENSLRLCEVISDFLNESRTS